MSKAIVIGGSGFVGHHLIRELALKNGVSVVSVDIKEPRERVAGVNYIMHDVRKLSYLKGHGDAEIIYNLAAIHTTPGHDYWEYYDTNVRGAIETTKFAITYGIRKLIFTSSISVYGPSESQKDESSPPAPNSAYGWSKLLAEDVFRAWNQARPDSKLLVVRPAVVFGEGERGNYTRLAGLLSKGVFFYPGRRDTIKACIYIKDLLTAVDDMWKIPSSYTLFNACYPERYKICDVVEEFKLYFPKVRSIDVPEILLMTAARWLMVIPNKYGIHPERVLKLAKSTNIYPAKLVEQGLTKPRPLATALADWYQSTGGQFS